MPSQYKVHFVYLVPSDKVSVAERAIPRVAQHLQAWYRWQMGNRKTFQFDFQTFRTPHTEEWYSTNECDPGAPHREWYWGNALTDARDLAGAGFYQTYDDWCVYLDAPTAPDQHAGGTSGGWYCGVCVLPAKDVASICGVDPDWTLCRGIGGCGHELGHTFGLPHPPAGPEFGRAVMGTGYGSYPNAILTEADKSALNTNPFFSVRGAQAPPGVCPFLMRPQRPPRPRPIPVPRP